MALESSSGSCSKIGRGVYKVEPLPFVCTATFACIKLDQKVLPLNCLEAVRTCFCDGSFKGLSPGKIVSTCWVYAFCALQAPIKKPLVKEKILREGNKIIAKRKNTYQL